MELTWPVIVLLVASLGTMCKAHPYGVKGGSSGGSTAGASAAAIAGAGAVSGSGGPGAGSGSGSFSGSISKSASSSYAAATSGSFSFSGSGAGPFSGLGSNLFNFPLNSGCAKGKCETGEAGNQFGLSPNSAGSISGAGAGSFALPSVPDLNNKHPCSGDCLNKQPPTCEGSQCQYPVSISENPEPNDIPVNVGYKQVPTGKPCQTENCDSSPNKDINQHYSSNYNNGPPNSYVPQNPKNAPSNPSSNNNLPNTNNNNNPDVGSFNNKLPNPYDSPENHQTPPTSQNNPESFSPLNKPSRACDSGKCKENSATSNIGTVSNPSTPSSFNSAPLCSNGNCGSLGVQNTKPPYVSPTYKTPTTQNIPFPCNTGNCKYNPNQPNNIPNQPTFNYPASPSNEDEPVYTGGFGGPSGILKPNDYTAPLPSNSDQPGNQPAQMLNNPENYNSHPNPSDANSPNLGNYPNNKPLGPKDSPQSPLNNVNLPNASPQNPTSPSSYGTPVKAPYNNMKSPLPNKSFPVSNEAPTLPEPSRLLTTPKESFPQTPENDDLYSPDQPSSYHVPIIPNKDSVNPNSNNDKCNSPKCKNKASTPPVLDNAPSASNPACVFGACNRPEKNSLSTPNYPSSQEKTPDVPIIATSTVNVQLSNIPESSDDSPEFDVRYTSPNCVNGNCAKETSSENGNYPFRNQPTNSQNPSFKPAPSAKTPCQNGNCQDNYPISASSPSSPSCTNGKCSGSNLPTTPSGEDYNSNIPFNTNQPTYPSGCLNGECGGNIPSSPVTKPYYPENLPSNYYPQPSYSECSNGKCSETDLGPPQDNPSIAGGPTINNSPKPCSNGQCGQNVPRSPGRKPYIPGSHALNDAHQLSDPGCSDGKCSPQSPLANYPLNYYPQPSNPANALQGKPGGKPNTLGSSPNNYLQQSTPECSNGQCDKNKPNSPAYNPSSPSPIYYTQPVPSSCLHGKCGENFPSFPSGEPFTPGKLTPNNYAETTSSNCQNGACPGGIPVSSAGANYDLGIPFISSYPQKSLSGCLGADCSESYSGSPAKGQFNPHKLPSGPGCVNNNCGTAQPCANGKCRHSPNTPHQPNLPENLSRQDKPIYGGGFGGPSGILKPNDNTAPLTGTPAQSSPLPHFSPNKPGHYNSQPSIPSPYYPNQNSPTLLDNQPNGSQAQANPHNSGNVPHSASPKYPNTGLTDHSANTPHFGAASSPIAAGSISISGSNAYTGGFGGPPGYLKPFDNPKDVKPEHSGLSPNTEPHHSVSSPLYGSGAYDATGSYSGGNVKTSEGSPKEPGCGGGCRNAGSYGGSGSFGVGGSLGLAKNGFDALIGGLSGAAASAKSLAGALAGTSGSGGSGSQSLSGSFAASSAVASSGGYKGGYGR